MTTEIIKGVIAVVVIIGAIVSIFFSNSIAQEFLIPLAGFAFGYYFKQQELPIVSKIRTVLARNKNTEA